MRASARGFLPVAKGNVDTSLGGSLCVSWSLPWLGQLRGGPNLDGWHHVVQLTLAWVAHGHSYIIFTVPVSFAAPYLNMSPVTKATVAVIQFIMWVNR